MDCFCFSKNKDEKTPDSLDTNIKTTPASEKNDWPPPPPAQSPTAIKNTELDMILNTLVIIEPDKETQILESPIVCNEHYIKK
jgi:hypothetical protein